MRFSELPPNRELRRTRRLDVLQTAVVGAVDLVAAVYELLSGAAIRDIENTRLRLFTCPPGAGSRRTSNELAAAERLIAALYASMNDFALFTSLSLFYFAAAVFTETARRLGRSELAGGFLMHDHPTFGPQSRDCLERARQYLTPEQRQELMRQIQRVIEPFDVAGLSDHSRRNWYPVKAEDLFGATGKLGASRAEIEQLLSRSGFFEAEYS